MEIDGISLILLFISGIFVGIGIGRASLTKYIEKLENKNKHLNS